MKKQQLLLTNPCTENWDDMQTSKVGRYCETCTKHIVDLTTKTDAELIAFFKKKKDNVCGRLLSTQLNRDLVTPAQKSNWQWLLPIALGASIFTPAKADQLKPVIVQNDNLLSSDFSNAQLSDVKVTKDNIVQGKVLNEETGKPLANVKIKRKGFNNVIAITDSAGNFKLLLSDQDKTGTFTFELNGFTVAEQIISNNMVVKMGELRIMLGGIATINTSNEPLYVVYSGKRSCEVDLKKINPDWIEKVDILKDAKAAALYGSKGANGVVLVEIKKQYANKIDFSKKK